MKLNKRQVEKIVKMLKNNEYIIDTLVERAGNMIEDCDEEQDVLEEGDYLLINYSAEGDVRITKEPSTYFTPGWMDEELVYNIYVDSIEWFVPNDDDDKSLFVDAESLDKINESLKDLYHTKEYNY